MSDNSPAAAGVESTGAPAYPSPDLIECPYPFFEAMLERGPVQRSAAGEYLVFGHADLKRVLREHETFSVLGVMETTPFDRGAATMISNRVNEDHRAIRRLATRPITPGRLKQMEPQILALVDVLIEGFAGKDEIDFMSEFALPIPGLLMCELMGIPKESEDGHVILHHWSDMVAAGDGTADGAEYGDESLEGHAFSLTDMADMFERNLRERYASPGDDMLSEFVRLQVDRDGEPDFDYLTSLTTEMLVGGAGTTALMFSNALWLMLTNPGEMAKIRADYSLIPGMLEESLRMESVIQNRERVALRDTELSGVQIPAGSRLRLAFAAGNRDPEAFEAPDEFKVDRPARVQKDNFGFGLGVHTCPGAPLARLEGRIAFERLFDHVGDVRLSPRNDYTHVNSTFFRSFKELWIEFDRRP